jgi:DNA helicase-2/ATP-dependent DNA helicase PcrA
MIQSFQVINENQDAFYITDHVSKKQISARKKMLLQREWQKFKILKNYQTESRILPKVKKEIDGSTRCLIRDLWKMWHWQQIWIKQ